MDRQIIYPGAVPLETDLLNTNRNILIALGLLAQDIFGSSTVVGGLPCTPTAPASLNVLMGPGRIYEQENVDNLPYSSLPADTTDQIVKQGINLQTTQLSCPAPTTAGFSINYLIEATYQDVDGNLVTLPYYNAANPASPFSGPGNSGAQQATQRQGVVHLQAKVGIPAPTGTQATPSADSGYVGLYIVTVAFGQTIITGANIQVAPGAPFIASLLLTQPIADGRYLQKSGGTLTGALAGTTAAFISMTVNGVNVQSANMLTSGTISASLVPLGAVTQYQNLLSLSFNQLTGQIFNSQVPLSAVQQYQANLTISFSQMSGSAAAGQVPALSSLNGQVSNGQVPSSAVLQYEASFVIAWTQITGTKNADQLQGLTSTTAASPNTIMVRDSGGYAYAIYFNQASSNNEGVGVSQVLVTNGTDNFFRKVGIASFQAQLSLSSIGGFLNAATQLSGTVPAGNLPGLSSMPGLLNAATQLSGTVPSSHLPGLSGIAGLLDVTTQLSGIVPNSHLPNIGSMPGITIAADPGTVPSGSPGQVFEYF